MDLLFHFLLAVFRDISRARTNATREIVARLETIRAHKRVLNAAVAAGDRRQEIETLMKLGDACAAPGEMDNSIRFYQQALYLAADYGAQDLQMMALADLGAAYQVMLDFPQAFSYYKEGLEIARKAGDSPSEQTISRKIETLYYTMQADELSRNFDTGEN